VGLIMATLETQYKNFLKSNPTSTFTFEEWKKKWADDIRPIIEELNNPPIEWKLYEQYAEHFVGYEDIPDYEWFKHELKNNEAFREKFGPPIVSDNFQIGPDGAYEHED